MIPYETLLLTEEYWEEVIDNYLFLFNLKSKSDEKFKRLLTEDIIKSLNCMKNEFITRIRMASNSPILSNDESFKAVGKLLDEYTVLFLSSNKIICPYCRHERDNNAIKLSCSYCSEDYNITEVLSASRHQESDKRCECGNKTKDGYNTLCQDCLNKLIID